MCVSSDVNRPTSPEVEIVPWLAGAAWLPRRRVEAWPSQKMWMFALDLVICIPSANPPSNCLHSQTRQMSMMMAKLDLPWKTTAVSSCKWRVWRMSSRISCVRFVRETWQLLSSTIRRALSLDYALSAPPAVTSSVRRYLQARLVIVAVSLHLPQQGGWWQATWTVELAFPDSDGFVGDWIPPASTRRPTWDTRRR